MEDNVRKLMDKITEELRDTYNQFVGIPNDNEARKQTTDTQERIIYTINLRRE